MKYTDVFNIVPLEHDEVPGAVVGWHVIGVADNKIYTEPAFARYGYPHYSVARNWAKVLCVELQDQVDEILLP